LPGFSRRERVETPRCGVAVRVQRTERDFQASWQKPLRRYFAAQMAERGSVENQPLHSCD